MFKTSLHLRKPNIKVISKADKALLLYDKSARNLYIIYFNLNRIYFYTNLYRPQ